MIGNEGIFWLVLTKKILRRVGVLGALAHPRRIVAHTTRALEIGEAKDVDRNTQIATECNPNGCVGTGVIRRFRISEQIDRGIREVSVPTSPEMRHIIGTDWTDP